MDEEKLAQIQAALEVHNIEGVRSILSELHPSDIASLLHYLDFETKLAVIRALPPDRAAEVLSKLEEIELTEILDALGSERITNLIEASPSDEATDLVGHLSAAKAEKVLTKVEAEDREEVTELIAYDPETAGGIMVKEYLALQEDATIEAAIREIRRQKKAIESKRFDDIHEVFVVGRSNQLKGQVLLRNLILSDEETILADIMDTELHAVEAHIDQEEVARIVKQYDLVVVPVIDDNGCLVGRITVDDVIDIIEAEASEDMYKSVGLDTEEKVFSPLFFALRRRLPWLYVNMFTALLAASVVLVFEATIAELTALAVLMPIVAGMGGNAGTQTITIIVRGLALRELEIRDASRALTKEVALGVLNGLAIGFLVGLLVFLWKGNYLIGVVLALAMIFNLALAGISGVVVPLGLKLFGVDPALAAGVFVTTITDIGGFFFLLGLATLLLHSLL